MMNHSLIIHLEYFQFGPSILGIYILVPKLYKNYSSVPSSFYIELRMVYWWNFSMVMYLQFGPLILVKLRFGPCFGKLSF
jgi:hypothetical protein